MERMDGTFQDRLVTELRLAGASTIADANRVLSNFLQCFNEQFRVPAREHNEVYRPLGPEIHLDKILYYKHYWKVAKDNTLRYCWHRKADLQLRWDQGGGAQGSRRHPESAP